MGNAVGFMENNSRNYRATGEDEVLVTTKHSSSSSVEAIVTKHSPSSSLLDTKLELQFRGVSLEFLKYILSKGDEYGRANGNDIKTLLTLPETKSRRCSLAELYSGQLGRVSKPLVGKIRFFVSHAWSYKFHELVEAIESFERWSDERGDAKKLGAYYFIDYFAINQWESAEELKSLGSLIKGSDALVLVVSPLNQPTPMSRAWCLYELHISMKYKIPMYVTVSKDQRLTATNLGALRHWKVDSKNSDATKKSDEYMIKTEIKQSIGFACLDLKVYEAIVSCMRILALSKSEFADRSCDRLVFPSSYEFADRKSIRELFLSATESTSKWYLTRILCQLLPLCCSSLIGGEVVYISSIIAEYIGYPFYCRCRSDYTKGDRPYTKHFLSCGFCKLGGSEWYCPACKSSFKSEVTRNDFEDFTWFTVKCLCDKEYELYQY